jgi:hypothetical protein
VYDWRGSSVDKDEILSLKHAMFDQFVLGKQRLKSLVWV